MVLLSIEVSVPYITETNDSDAETEKYRGNPQNEDISDPICLSD